MLRGQRITFQDLGYRGREAALASLEAQGFMGEGAASRELGHRGRDGALATLEAQGFTEEGSASSELGHRGGMACAEIYRKADLWKYPGGCPCMQLSPVVYAGITLMPTKPIGEKSDKCRSCGWVLGVEVRVRGGVCNPCYQKPEATAARKQATAGKKDARGRCITPNCKGMDYGS